MLDEREKGWKLESGPITRALAIGWRSPKFCANSRPSAKPTPLASGGAQCAREDCTFRMTGGWLSGLNESSACIRWVTAA